MVGFFNFFLFTLHRSLFTVIFGAAILGLALFSPCSAFMAVSGEGTAQQGKSANPRPTSSSRASWQNENGNGVLNILVDRIDGGVIYSRDGQQYEIGTAKVSDNSRRHPTAKTKTAELFFQNGSVVSVVLK